MQNDHETKTNSFKQKGEPNIQIMLTADQIYTNVSKDDSNHNGQTLTLKTDQTFNFDGQNHSWSSDSITWNWDQSFSIEGTWSYDKEIKTITLTATKFDDQEKNAKHFPNRVISTSNFSFQQSKEIKCFVVRWDYNKFEKVSQGILKRK